MIEVIKYTNKADAGLRAVLLCTVLFACLLAGLSLAYFTAEDEKERFVEIERIELSLNETWDENAGIQYAAGLNAEKRPVFTAGEGSMYARVRITIEEYVTDAQGETTTQPVSAGRRLELIKGVLWADMGGVLGTNSYTKEQLVTMQTAGAINKMYDSSIFVNPTQPDATKGVFYFEYNGVMAAPDTATLFTNVVIPSNYTPDDIALMGNFIISIDGQGIQSYGFTNQAEAMQALNQQTPG